MKYNLLCFQSSCRLIIFFHKHDYQVSTSLMKEHKRYKRLKTAKWISIRRLVPGLLLTVRSAGKYTKFANLARLYFQNLQHFATKHCNFTNCKTLCPAVVINFVTLPWIKTRPIAVIAITVFLYFLGFEQNRLAAKYTY